MDKYQQITFVLTSCRRFDLLTRTLESFFSHDDAKLIDHFIITEDSGDPDIYRVLKKFPDIEFEVIFNQTPKGQFLSIDNAYQKAETPYIFHCEDDWLFTKPDFMKPSLTLLKDFPELVQVLIRDPAEERHGSVDVPLISHKNISYRRPDPKAHPIWYGYSFNPGLRRTADLEKIGPFHHLLNEVNISIEVKKLGYCQAMLENGGVQHIGKHRHVAELFWSRPRLFRRLKNSIIKRTIGWADPVDMLKPLPISCFIVAHNEADRIERALTSVKNLVDEIIVVDSGSTDDTVKIAESYGAKVFHHLWEGDGPQKRFAENQCRNDWLLNIDADEWLEINLIENIRRLFKNGTPDKPVWCLPRGDIYFGDRALRWHMNLEKMPRLYDRRKLRFTPINLHTSVPRPKGETGYLKGVLFHAHARLVSDMITKEMNYAKIGMRDKPLPILILRLFLDFPQCFLKHYFLRRHVFGGHKGFIYSMVRGYVRFLRTAMEVEKKLHWVEKEAERPTPPPLSKAQLAAIKPVVATGYIVTCNEGNRIGRALASMQQLVREIVVVDNGSTDNTREIVQSYGAKIIDHPWEGHGKQKYFAEAQCPEGWLLNLDSDEWLSPKLVRSIQALFEKSTPPHPVYAFYRNDLYLGKIKLWPFMKRHPFMRLYDSRVARFNKENVIDNVDYPIKKAKKLKGRLFHIAIKSIWHVAEKENNYSNIEKQRLSKSWQNLYWRLWLEMPIFFFKFYIIRGTIFGGLQGFCYAMIYSFARFQRIAKLLENNRVWKE